MDHDFESDKIEMVASGLLPSHEEGFRVDYRGGHPEFGFVYFYTPVMLEDCSGRHLRPAGTGIFFLPNDPRFYYPITGSLRHTWFLANGSKIDRCMEHYKIPGFAALDLPELPFLDAFITDVRHEGVQLQDYYEDAVTDLFHDFLRRIGALLAESTHTFTDIQRNKVKMLNEVRLSVHTDIARRWSVQEMADLEGLNPTRFAMEYRLQFGISPIDDLIDARLKRAEYMLTHLSYKVKQIAGECGFQSEEHFSRLFHSRRGCSPGQFRKR